MAFEKADSERVRAATEINNVLAQIEAAHVSFSHAATAAFSVVENADPELTGLMLQVLEHRRDASAEWLCHANRALGGIMPLKAIATGRRQDVIELLNRIEYGAVS